LRLATVIGEHFAQRIREQLGTRPRAGVAEQIEREADGQGLHQ
jgi:hypothetical protein